MNSPCLVFLLFFAEVYGSLTIYGNKWELIKLNPIEKKRYLQYLKSVTSIYPETVLKIYATDKKLNFVSPWISFKNIHNRMGMR